MRTENEIIEMFALVSICHDYNNYEWPFYEWCECTEDACRKQWKSWLSKGEVNNEE